MDAKLQTKVAHFHNAVDILAPYLAAEFPSMGNRTPGSIVDDIGPIKDLVKEAEKVIKTLQGIADSKLMPGESQITGEQYVMKLVPMTQVKLHQETAKKVLTEVGRLNECMYELDMTQHRFTKVK